MSDEVEEDTESILVDVQCSQCDTEFSAIVRTNYLFEQFKERGFLIFKSLRDQGYEGYNQEHMSYMVEALRSLGYKVFNPLEWVEELDSIEAHARERALEEERCPPGI